MRTESTTDFSLNRIVATLVDRLDEMENRLQALEDFCDSKDERLNAIYRNLKWENNQLANQIEKLQRDVEQKIRECLPKIEAGKEKRGRKPGSKQSEPKKLSSLAIKAIERFNDTLVHFPANNDVFQNFSSVERCAFILREQDVPISEIAKEMSAHKTTVARYLRDMVRKAGCYDFADLKKRWALRFKEVKGNGCR